MIPFAFEYNTPTGLHPNGVHIGFHADPHLYGNYIEGQYQPPFVRSSLKEFIPESKDVSLFSLEQGKRRYIYVLTTLGGPDGWLGSRYSSPGHSSLFCNVHPKVIQAQREGRCMIVINQCWEGFCPVQYNIFERIHRECERYNLILENVLYLSGNLRIEELHKEWMIGNQLRRSFTSKGLEYFGDMAQLQIQNNPHLLYDYEEPTYEKDYVCLNRRPHNHRLMLVAELNHRNLLEKGYVSCPPLEMVGTANPARDFHAMGADEKWQKIKSKLPLIVDKTDFIENHALDMTYWMYRNSWFTVVTETLYQSKMKTVFLSEKIYKPILFHHPFIVISQPGFLKQMRNLGYRTFHPHINEDYDDIPNDNERMYAITQEIERLCRLSAQEKKQMATELLKERVSLNRELLLSRKPHTQCLEETFKEFIGRK